MAKGEKDKEPKPSDIISGALNIFGLKLDLGELLDSPENLASHLEELREKLKAAGGKEVLSDQEWREGRMSVTGHIRTRGVLGEQEYHIGTAGKGGPGRKPPQQPVEPIEPPFDIFDEGEEITVIADVPGVSMDDLELKVEGSAFSLSTRPTAHRIYRKELRLEAEVEPASLQSTCNNGVLEVRLRKRKASGG
jgi:HSP20 family protein